MKFLSAKFDGFIRQLLLQKSSIIDIWQCLKYTSGQGYIFVEQNVNEQI